MIVAATHPFIQSLEHIAGFLLVVSALVLLWALTILIGTFFKKGIITPIGTTRQTTSPYEVEEPSEEEVAAIAACVVTLFGRRSRIVSIRSTAKDWSREGRREQFASHKIR